MPEAGTKQTGEGRATGPFRLLPVAFIVAALLAVVIAGWYRAQQPVVHAIDGWTMGSTWSLRVAGPRDLDVVTLRTQLEAQLGELDRQLSGYRDNTALSRLNNAPVGEWVELPPHLGAVLRFGRQLHDDTDGAFDLTVKPLVNLWGFGAADPRSTLPTDAEIAAAKARTGARQLEISADGTRVRRLAAVGVDVDAVAPGYAADVLAGWLDAHGLPNHLVEIGGEMRAGGARPDGAGWRIGIERPVMARGDVGQVIAVHDGGVATSGDYRDFVEIAGQRYSHTLDPASGRPVTHDLASVTVIAPDGLAADGYATALMVLGPERGMAWAKARRLPVFMIIRTANGELAERYNEAFRPFLVVE